MAADEGVKKLGRKVGKQPETHRQTLTEGFTHMKDWTGIYARHLLTISVASAD